MKKTSRFLPLTLSAFAFAIVLPATPATAAILYDTAGSNYGQNFNTLESTGTTHTWTNDTTLQGWYYWQSQGTSNPNTYTVSAGSSAIVSTILSLGDATGDNAGDRALGAQSSSSSIAVIHYGMQLRNTTELTLTSFTLNYTGEQWRAVNQAQDTLFLEYGVFPEGSANRLNENTSTGWTSVSGLNFNTPTSATTGTQLDGNAASNRVELEGTVNGVNWAPGQDLWIRWRDTGSQQMMGIDDVSFSAVPEPTSALLLGLGALLMGMRRRR